MNYLVCEKPGQFLLKDKEAPKRGEGEALLQILKVGICGTDLHAYRGNQAFFTYPRILGHELATKVLEIDDNPQGIRSGDRVVVMPYISCKKCVACRKGKTNCCTNIKVLGVHVDGGMQEKITVPNDLLLPAGQLTSDQMAIVEPLAIGAHALRRAALKTGETLVVMGCGPIGIGILKLAQLAGAKVIAIDRDQNRLTYAKNEIGVEYAVNANDQVIERIREITNGDMADVVIDATGHKSALESGIDYMAHGGSYVLVGLSKGELMFKHPAIHAKEATILCSRNATLEDFKKVISVLETGAFPIDSYITHTVGYQDMIAHFEGWSDPRNGVIKAMITF
ncbi:MAG: zinc-binding alcohol dehydrogenase family protein [Maribacter sp.]|nr:zinc-binding alcohol dehydrogenase family protein [Maribacter sp.]